MAAGKALAVGGGLLALAFFATRKSKAAPPTEQPLPTGTGDALRAMLETRLVNGQRVQYFKVPVIRDAVMGMMSASSLAQHTQSGPQLGLGPASAVFLVFDGVGPVMAAQAINAATSTQGLAVLGSLTLPIPARVPRLVAFVPPGDRVLAPEGSAWAVLADPAGEPLPVLAPGQGATPPGEIPPGGVTDRPPTGLDPNLPAGVRAQVEALLADPNADPAALEEAADMLEDQGFPIAAARLRERAQELRLKEQMAHVKLGGSPFQVREGDLPSVVAQHYTGNFRRWTEIAEVPRNKSRGMSIIIKDGQPWSLTKWIDEVLLPLDWKIWEKSLPPRKTGGGAQKPDKEETDPDLQALAEEIAEAAQGMGGGLQPPGSALASTQAIITGDSGNTPGHGL